MASLFPDAYMHIGGDEVNGKQWNDNPKIQEFMKKNGLKDNHLLQAYFNRKILRILEKHGKRMIGWDEIYQPDLPRSIVIHSWRGKEALVDAARRGFPVILSNGYYIDLNQPTDFHYLNDPVPGDSPLTAEERKLVLGGEATMWSEIVTAETVDSRVWPRTAAIAERLWSAGTVRDVDEMYRRLDVVDRQLEEAGLTHLKNREAMLRRLAGGGDAHPLRTLLGAIEPLTGYDRHKVGVTYTSFSPFTRMVDAAVADPRPAREFNRRVDRFLGGKDEDALAELKEQLARWKENHQSVQSLVERSPVLNEVETLSEDLSAAAALGLEALDILTGKQKAGPSWIAEAKRLLERAGPQRGELELAILPAITKLVEAASGKRSEFEIKKI